MAESRRYDPEYKVQAVKLVKEIGQAKAAGKGAGERDEAFKNFYHRARISGLWDRILEHLIKKTRTNAGREESPSYAIVDPECKNGDNAIKRLILGEET